LDLLRSTVLLDWLLVSAFRLDRAWCQSVQSVFDALSPSSMSSDLEKRMAAIRCYLLGIGRSPEETVDFRTVF
jgi:hypothetical protein